MFSHQERLLFPVHAEHSDPRFGQILLEHYGGKDSEFSAATQYLNHRSNMKNRYLRELLGLIAAEELSHMEMIAVAINKLGGPPLCYINSQGIPWNMSYVDQSLDPIARLEANAEAEIRARALYNLHLTMTNDPGMRRMITFLGSREDVHKHLFLKAKAMLLRHEPLENFSKLISEYRNSLRMVEN